MDGTLTQEQALAAGGKFLDLKQQDSFSKLSQATDFYLQWGNAARILFPDNEPAGVRGTIYTWAKSFVGKALVGQTQALTDAVGNGELPLPPGMHGNPADPAVQQSAGYMYSHALTTLQEVQKNFIIPLRSGMGEKGNFAKAIVDQALQAGPNFWDDATSAGTRIKFFGGLLAIAKRTQGIPRTPDEVHMDHQMDALANSDPELAAMVHAAMIENGIQGNSLSEGVANDLRGGPQGLPGVKDPELRKLLGLED
jgi:hypothetical protein